MSDYLDLAALGAIIGLACWLYIVARRQARAAPDERLQRIEDEVADFAAAFAELRERHNALSKRLAISTAREAKAEKHGTLQEAAEQARKILGDPTYPGAAWQEPAAPAINPRLAALRARRGRNGHAVDQDD